MRVRFRPRLCKNACKLEAYGPANYFCRALIKTKDFTPTLAWLSSKYGLSLPLTLELFYFYTASAKSRHLVGDKNESEVARQNRMTVKGSRDAFRSIVAFGDSEPCDYAMAH